MPRHLSCILSILLTAFFVTVGYAQEGIPQVEMVGDNYEYILSLFPDDYPDRQAARASCTTIADETDSLGAFWTVKGKAVLAALSSYAGVAWIDTDFKIYLVKYYPDFTCLDPMTIPLEGKKNGPEIVAVPGGLSPYFTLFQLLSRRLLNHVGRPGATSYAISGHPLMEKTDRRFDNMVNFLALRTMSDFFPPDSVLALFQSAHWKMREPGQDVLFGSLWDKWRISADTTLAYRISKEPVESKLVQKTRVPDTKPKYKPLPGGAPPSGGKFGVLVSRDRSGLYKITDIDTTKAAYRSGLRKNDLIRTVGGSSARSVKDLYALLIEKSQAGVEVRFSRGGDIDAVILYARD